MPYFVKSSMAELPPAWQLDESTLAPPGAEWADLRDDNSESLKIWLPPAVLAAAGELGQHYLQSVTLILRNALVIHAYGRVMFDRLVAAGYLRPPRGYAGKVLNPKSLQMESRHSAPEGAAGDRFDRADDPPAAQALYAHRPTFGARVFMPPRLKRDLTALAQANGLPLSEYCREALTLYYLGHRSTPAAPAGNGVAELYHRASGIAQQNGDPQ